MGTVAFGLGQIGAGLQQARDQRRQEAIDQQYADIAKQYARTNQQRAVQEQAEFEERMRVARLPKFIGFRTVGGRLYYGLQNPDGSVKTNEVTGITSAQDAEGLETAIEALPTESQPSARAAIVPYLQAGDYPGARAALKPISEANVKSTLPQPTTTTVTSGTQRVLVDVPGQPGKYMFQDVPVSSTRTTYKGRGAPAQMTPPASPSVPLVRTPPSQMPKNQKLKPEMDAGLRVLHVSLWGSGTIPGLDSTLKVLDEGMTRKRLMLLAGVGSVPDPKESSVSKLFKQQIYTQLSTDEKAFAYQLNRALSAINSLRGITGLPRSTQQLMDQYARELPNLVVTPSSADAKVQMQLIEREIQAAMGPTTTGTTGDVQIPTPLASGSTDQPAAPQPPQPPSGNVDDALDRLFGKPKPPR